MTAPPTTTQAPHRLLAFAALATAGCLWGTGFLFGKLAFTQLSVGHMLFYRLFFATIGFFPLVFIHPVRFDRKDWIPLILASFFGVPEMFLIQFEGLSRTTLSHAALMIGTGPVFLVLGAAIVFREKINRVVWGALATSTLGVLLVVMPASGAASSTHASATPNAFGDLLVILSLLGGTAWVLISKHLTKRYPPLSVTGYVMSIGGVMLCAWVLFHDGPPPVALPTNIWLVLIASGLVSTVLTTVLWNWGLTHVQASHAAIFLNFEPIVGALFGITLFHDPMSFTTVIGGLLIISAAAVISWYEG